MDYPDKDLYIDSLEAMIELRDDCDEDCQAAGSQLTTVAILMSTVYGVVCLQALIMFVGTWRYRWRACAIYCTMFSCVFHLAVTIASGTLLLTKYNAVCSRSMV